MSFAIDELPVVHLPCNVSGLMRIHDIIAWS